MNESIVSLEFNSQWFLSIMYKIALNFVLKNDENNERCELDTVVHIDEPMEISCNCYQNPTETGTSVAAHHTSIIKFVEGNMQTFSLSTSKWQIFEERG